MLISSLFLAFEFYRYLGMLKSYRVLNRTGFAKVRYFVTVALTRADPVAIQAVKKFEKVTSIPCGIQYKPKIENTDFVSSPDLDELIRKTEDAFATVFEHGNRKKALERLRDFGRKQDHHFASWRAGLLMGAAIPLMIEGLVISESASKLAHSLFADSLSPFPQVGDRKLGDLCHTTERCFNFSERATSQSSSLSPSSSILQLGTMVGSTTF